MSGRRSARQADDGDDDMQPVRMPQRNQISTKDMAAGTGTGSTTTTTTSRSHTTVLDANGSLMEFGRHNQASLLRLEEQRGWTLPFDGPISKIVVVVDGKFSTARLSEPAINGRLRAIWKGAIVTVAVFVQVSGEPPRSFDKPTVG
mmetsp:Transcript_6588/g.10052  ORF Transcript_6588/g.10052 Transcript_6588/m.10052 type:complete len:146 (-) Transcript_6588:333-770(-)